VLRGWRDTAVRANIESNTKIATKVIERQAAAAASAFRITENPVKPVAASEKQRAPVA
jgi:hypothetical protein